MTIIRELVENNHVIELSIHEGILAMWENCVDTIKQSYEKVDYKIVELWIVGNYESSRFNSSSHSDNFLFYSKTIKGGGVFLNVETLKIIKPI